MITDSTVTCSLSVSCQNAYEKIKALIVKIFSLFKSDNSGKDLKEEFYESYIDFARKLDKEGHRRESNSYMMICRMYLDLMDRPKEFIEHESFFIDLFKAFDELLSAKINRPDEYDEEYERYLLYKGKMEEYYYSNLAVPSPYFDEDGLNRLTGCLVGDFNECIFRYVF